MRASENAVWRAQAREENSASAQPSPSSISGIVTSPISFSVFKIQSGNATCACEQATAATAAYRNGARKIPPSVMRPRASAGPKVNWPMEVMAK